MNKLKLLLVLLTPFLLISCSSTYPSRKQASLACNEWRDKGEPTTYIEEELELTNAYKEWKRKRNLNKPRFMSPGEEYRYWVDGFDGDVPPKKHITREVEKTRWNRFCVEEEETSQFRGEEWNKNDELKVKANFRY